VTDAPSRAIALFGTEERVARPKTLRAGPLTVELENGNLRYLRYQGVEVLRAVAFLVRDGNWATYGAAIDNLKVGQGPDNFTVGYDATCKDDRQELRYRATIAGRADGALCFEVEGEAVSDFLTNRAGFIVLHPLDGVAGEPVEVTHTDGTVEKTRFPRLISPAQPIFDIRALTHEVLPGVQATCTMTGDAYEMEDQRNWTDASYKTYFRPLSKPKPYTLGAGETIRQSVSLSFRGAPTVREVGAEEGISVAIGAPTGRPMPRIGLWVPPQEAERACGVVDRIEALGLNLLVGRLDLREPSTMAALRHLKSLANAVAAPVVLEIVLPNRAALTEELAAAAVAVSAAGLRLEAVVPSPHEYLKSWQPQERWPDCPLLEEIYHAARSVFPGVLIGGGLLSYFTELNRKRPPVDHIDFVTHATCPIVHDCDDRAVMETLEALPWVAESVRAFAPGKPYRVGPSMLGMRDNPYGAAPMPNPDNRRIAMAINDPRQRGLFGAAWNLGYAARMAEADIEALILSAPVGPFGVVYARTDYPQPWFDERGAGVYPVYHVIRGLARAAGRPRLKTTSSHPGTVQALAWRDGGGPVLWLANVTGQSQTVAIATLPAEEAMMARLDLERFGVASAGPDGLTRTEASGSASPLVLGPYELARLEWAADPT
jgi:D-apionolactonase